MLLTLAESLYELAATSYHRRWDKRAGANVSVPVISVGNLTVGGNGKTPFVIELVRIVAERFPELREPNRIAVLSRGYGRQSQVLTIVERDTLWKASGDEPLLIKRNSPQVLVIAHANRVESARVAVERFGSHLIILDDGFQHRPLARNLDLVLLDSHQPLGNGRLLPAGTLRERVSALSRATHFVAVGNGEKVGPLANHYAKPIFRAEPRKLSDIWLRKPSGPVFLLAGIARPERVRSYLESAGLQIVGDRSFRDHHIYTQRELVEVAEAADKCGAEAVITTAKDRVRIPSWDGLLPLLEIPYQLAILDAARLLENVDNLLQPFNT